MYYNEEDRDMLVAKMLVYALTAITLVAVTITVLLLS